MAADLLPVARGLAAGPADPRARRARLAAGRRRARRPEPHARVRRRPVPPPFLARGGRAARTDCGPSTVSRCRRTPAASSPLYLDICPASVQAVPTRPHRRRPGRCARRSRRGPRPDRAAAGLRDDGDGPEPPLDLGPLVARDRHAPGRGPGRGRAGRRGRLSATSPPTSGSSAGSTSRGCSSSARSSSRTAARARSSGRSPRALPQLCLPQAADQFRNAEGGRRAGAACALMPAEITPEAVAGAVARLLEDDRRSTQRRAASRRRSPRCRRRTTW